MSPISQGLPPLPLSTSSYFEPMFTVDQMREYGDARAANARRVALKDAAKFLGEDARCRIAGAPEKIRSME